jgi:hypothetical protein
MLARLAGVVVMGRSAHRAIAGSALIRLVFDAADMCASQAK